MTFIIIKILFLLPLTILKMFTLNDINKNTKPKYLNITKNINLSPAKR